MIKKSTNLNIKNNISLLNYQAAILADSSSYINKKQIEATRKVISRIIRTYKPKPTFKTNIFFYIPYTKKAVGSRMGKGNGIVQEYITHISINYPLFLFNNISRIYLLNVLKHIRFKIPIRLKLYYSK